MISVEITNYESIKHAKIEIEGFTSLVGRNALGKSATLRAINAALTNKQGMEFIKWGEKFCEVHIIMEGLDLTWHKQSGNNYYIVNGEKYEKIGKDNPPDPVLEAGFKILKIGSDKINLNYAEQFSPLFLVDKMDSKSADLLTSVYGLDRLYKAVDLCNKDQRKNSDSLRLREKDLKLVEKDLDKFKGFEDIQDMMSVLAQEKNIISSEDAYLNQLKNSLEKILTLGGACRRMRDALNIELPNPKDLDTIFRDYKRLIGYHKKYISLTEESKKLNKIVDKKLPYDISKDFNTLLESIKKIKIWDEKYTVLNNRLKKLKRISDVDLPHTDIDPKPIEFLISKVDIIKIGKTKLKQLEFEINEVNNKIKEVSKELDSFDRCPLCGSERKIKHEHN